MNKAISFMAIARGTEAKEVEVKRYIGVGAVKVLAVNPTREELNKIYGSSGNTEEIKYVGEGAARNAKGEDIKAPQIRISFILKTDPTVTCNNGIEAIIPVNFFITKSYIYSNKNGVTKVQVIDRFGRTAWVTSEELKAGAIPEYEIKRGPNAGNKMKAQISEGYRPVYPGEEDLVKFLIALINIPRPDDWNEEQGTFVMKTDPKELAKSECYLEKINDYFSGNIKELKEAVTFQPNNRLKILFGIRNAQNGNMYQTAYTKLPLKLGVQNFKSLEKALEEDKAVGRHPSEIYEVCNLKEYTLSPTNYANEKESATIDPFASPAQTESVEAEPKMPLDVDPFAV